jgi:hypothetical protein
MGRAGRQTLVAEFAKSWQLSQLNGTLADLMDGHTKHLK